MRSAAHSGTTTSDGSPRRTSDTPSEPSKSSVPPRSPSHASSTGSRPSPSYLQTSASPWTWEQVGTEWLAGPGGHTPSVSPGERDLARTYLRVEGAEIDQLPLTDSPDGLEQTLAWFRLIAHRDFARADPVRPKLPGPDLTPVQDLAAHQLRSQLRRTPEGRAVILMNDLASIEASFGPV